jgi:hypothetical protein
VARFAYGLRHYRVKALNMSEPETFEQRSEKEIFFEALDKKSPEERAAFLDGGCGKNPARRTRVEALPDDHFQTAAFMKKPAVEAERAPVKLDPAGRRLGRYKLLEKTGEGVAVSWFGPSQQMRIDRIENHLSPTGIQRKGQ